MSRTTKLDWRQAELTAKKIAEAEGWECGLVYDKQGRQSMGPFDLVCYKNGKYRLIQVKLRRRENPSLLGKNLLNWYRRRFKGDNFSCEVWVLVPQGTRYQIHRFC